MIKNQLKDNFDPNLRRVLKGVSFDSPNPPETQFLNLNLANSVNLFIEIDSKVKKKPFSSEISSFSSRELYKSHNPVEVLIETSLTLRIFLVIAY